MGIKIYICIYAFTYYYNFDFSRYSKSKNKIGEDQVIQPTFIYFSFDFKICYSKFFCKSLYEAKLNES